MKKVLFLMLAILCSSCTNEDVGTFTGGVVGGVVGSQFGNGSGAVLASGLGAVIGSGIGGNIGRHMDRQDRMMIERNLETTPNGRVTTWVNPNTNYKYKVVPKKTYYRKNGTPCREYITTATIGNKKQQIYGKACRQSDGSWRVVN